MVTGVEMCVVPSGAVATAISTSGPSSRAAMRVSQSPAAAACVTPSTAPLSLSRTVINAPGGAKPRTVSVPGERTSPEAGASMRGSANPVRGRGVSDGRRGVRRASGVRVGGTGLGVKLAVGVKEAVALGVNLGVGVALGVMVAEGVTLAVAVGVGDGVVEAVAVALGVALAVTVGVGEAVAVSVASNATMAAVAVSVGRGVAEAVAVALGVAEGVAVQVSVGEAVAVGVRLGVWVAVGVAVKEGVGVAVALDVKEAVGVAVTVGVRVAVGEAVNVAVSVALSDAVKVAEGVGDDVRVDDGVAVGGPATRKATATGWLTAPSSLTATTLSACGPSFRPPGNVSDHAPVLSATAMATSSSLS